MGVEQIIDGNVDFSGIAQTASSGVFNLLSILLWVVIIGGVIAVILYILSYKNFVTLRVKTKNGKYIIRDKARTVNKDGVTYWRLLKLKKTVTPPPPGAIEITAKGKYFAECYWEEGNPEPVWLHDTNNHSESFQPFTTQERALHVSGVTKAVQRRKKGLLETIAQIAMPIAMIVVISVPFVFYGELSEPQKQIASSNAATTAQLKEISEQNARILSVMAGKLEANELRVKQDISPEMPPGVQ